MLPGYLDPTISNTQITYSCLLIHKSYNEFIFTVKFCSLFNDAVDSSMYIEQNGMVINRMSQFYTLCRTAPTRLININKHILYFSESSGWLPTSQNKTLPNLTTYPDTPQTETSTEKPVTTNLTTRLRSPDAHRIYRHHRKNLRSSCIEKVLGT